MIWWNNKKLGCAISKDCERLLTYLLVSESSHLFFLLWLPDFRPSTPPPLHNSYNPFPLPPQSTVFSPSDIITDPSQTHPASLETTLASIIFPQIECLTALYHSVSLSLPAPSKTPPPLCPLFFFLPLIGAGLNKEKLKGKGKICLSVSALLSVCASTSCADSQAGRGRALWSDFPYSLFFLFFFSFDKFCLMKSCFLVLLLTVQSSVVTLLLSS